MHFDQTAADGQAQAGAAHFAGGGGIHLRELLEDSLQMIVRNADTRIFDADKHMVVFTRGADGDFATLGKFDGVVDQVDHHLADADLIGVDLHFMI